MMRTRTLLSLPSTYPMISGCTKLVICR